MWPILSLALTFTPTADAIEVDTDVDIVASDGDCSLREALENANLDWDRNPDCGIIDPDRITFFIPLKASKVVFLDPGLGQLRINDDLIIEGFNRGFFTSRITVDGQSASRVFDIADLITVTIEDLVVRNAQTTSTGGGINIGRDAVTSLDNVRLAGNTAQFGGGVFSRGQLTVVDCEFSDNNAVLHGGGLDVIEGTADVTTSDFTDNSAAEGGGIHVHVNTEFFLRMSTVDNNEATSGGGIAFQSAAAPFGGDHRIWRSTISNNVAIDGGGLHIAQGTVELSASTVSNNDAETKGGGAFVDTHGVLVNLNSTYTQNHADDGGGIWAVTAFSTTLKSTVVAFNTSVGFGSTDWDLGGSTVPSLGFNFIGSEGTLSSTATDQYGPWYAPLNPMLHPLQRWQPSDPTETHMPMNTSQVIDQGTSVGGLAPDQRNATRTVIMTSTPADDGTDVGAVEANRQPA